MAEWGALLKAQISLPQPAKRTPSLVSFLLCDTDKQRDLRLGAANGSERFGVLQRKNLLSRSVTFKKLHIIKCHKK